jgi:multiple RNA-binding domain-containing protein 1
MPAEKKPEKKEEKEEKEIGGERKEGEKKSEFRRDKEKTLKVNFDDETNWNYLFMNQDSVATAMAKKLGMEKSKLLDRDSSQMAVKMAKSETLIINQTKEWLRDECGLDVDKLERLGRQGCKRSDRTLLVKNIPYSTKEHELREIFNRYGQLESLKVSPFNTLAIVSYATAA